MAATLKVKQKNESVRELVISMVRSARDTQTRDIEAEKVLEAIRTGGDKLKGQITQIRNRFEAKLAITGDREKAKRVIDGLKKQLPAVLWSGTFSHRANDKLVHHSGLLCADLDALGEQSPAVRNKLLTSPYLWALFLSPTADGLKAIFKVRADASQHQRSYRAVEKHVKDLAGVQIDEKGKDVARLCFMSYDPDLYVNADAVELQPLPEPEKPQRAQNDGEYPQDLSQRERIATERLGQLTWSAEKGGYFCNCPGKPLHTTLTVGRHTIVYLDGSPTIECKHSSCARIVEAFNFQLRSLIAKAEYHAKPDAPGKGKSTAEEDNTPDDQAIARLVALSPIDYDRCRKDEAKRLGLRPATLDAEVSARRTPHDPGAQGSAVEFPNVEPWPELVNGVDMLNEAAATFSRYLVLPSGAADALALWTAHTHAFEAFTHTPRLNFCSPEKGCGKTTALDVAASLTPRALRAENITSAVLFRLVDSCKPTLLLDEVDKYLPKAEELCGLLNAGHKRGAKAYRCEGENNTVRGFAAFGPAALAGIGVLPGTLHDRSIVVRLVRAKSGEVAARFDSRRIQRETELCRKLARWASDNFGRLKNCDPALPETAFNRLADNWRPLFAIAEIAGGEWPNRAKEAFTKLTSTEDLDAQGLGTVLLGDISATFTAKNTDKLFSAQLCEELAAIEGRPWAEWGRQRKPISMNQLATQLRRFSVSPHEIRIGEETGRGYELADFEDAFSRYLADTPVSDRNSETLRGKTVISEVKHTETVFHPENGPLQRECFSVSTWKGGSGQNADSGKRDIEADRERSAGKEKLRL